MVEPAHQRAREVLPRSLELDDLLVEDFEPATRYGLPFAHLVGVEYSVDVIEGKAGVLQHPDEDEAAERLGPVPPLPGAPLIGAKQATPLVVADGRGGDVGPAGHLADGEELRHGTT